MLKQKETPLPLQGCIDMHIHSAPDLRPRRLSDLALMEAAVRVGARAVVIKSHAFPTADRASLINEFYQRQGADPNKFTMFGGVALNGTIGGINPKAVEAALKLGGKVVWLPTMNSSNHQKKHGKLGGIDTVVKGKPVAALTEIFKMVRDYDAVLATGHLSPEEIKVVVDAARQASVDKIVITHPEFWVVGMTLDDQLALVKDYHVIFERCYAQPMGGGVYKRNLEINLQAIRKIGWESTLISTDGGQLENPEWPSSLTATLEFLKAHGIPKTQLDYMTKLCPSHLLGVV